MCNGRGGQQMATRERRFVRTLQRRGSALYAVVPSEFIKRLGWNRDDAVTYDVIDDSLVLTKIKLPPAPDLRVKSSAGREQE